MANISLNYRAVSIRMPVNSRTHAFLQQLHANHIIIRHIKVKNDEIQFEVSKAALPIIKKLRRKYKVPLRIRYVRYDDILRLDRTTFFGLLLLIVIPLWASSWIWQIQVNSELPELRVRLEQTLEQQLLMKPPFRKKYVADDMKIRQMLLEKHRDLAWVHIEKTGSHMLFTPQRAPEVIQLPVDDSEPVNLIASKNGVVTHFDIDKGIRAVVPNTTVYKGDLLVSGVLTVGDTWKAIGANGAVYADYWLESSFTMPRIVQLVGQQSRAWHILLNGVHTEQFHRQYSQEIALPHFLASFVKVVSVQTTTVEEQQITEENMTKLVIPLLQQKALQLLPPNTKIKKQNLLHVQIDDDTVRGKVLFLINENIAKKQSIDQGE